MYQVIVVPYTTAAYRLTADLWTLGNPINLVFALSNQIINFTITNTSPVRYSFLLTATYASAPSFAIGLYGTNSGGVNNSQSADLMIGDVQFELISGQSNTNPGEYVSVGMGLFTISYSNVDGVQCFGTKLANTMTGNVVNEIAGSTPLNTTNGASAMVCDAVGPLGILMDTQTTVAYGIEWDFTVAGAAGMTYQNKITAGPTGDYYACGIVETAGVSAHYINPYGTLPFATQNSFFGLFVKPYQRNNVLVNYSIGPDTVQTLYYLTGNGSTNGGYLAGGTGTFRGAGIIPYKDGWYFCWQALSGVAAGTAMNIGIFGESGTSYGGSGSPAWYLYGLTVVDTGSDPYTYPCQYAIATRGTDILSWAASGNMAAGVGTAYCEVKTKWQTAWQQRGYLTSETYKLPLMIQGSYGADSIGIYDGTNLAIKTGLPSTYTASRKLAASWGSGQQICTGSGQANVALTPFAGTMTASTMSVGYSPWVGLAIGGQIRNVRIWNVVSYANDLAALTA